MSVVPYPTIALVKGAAFAGGCMFSFAHDYIYVAGDGVFCANEADLGLHLPPGMMEILRKKHNSYNSLRDMTLLAKKFVAK
jgi:enoyl-CoA hydratase/carnithine racemase